MATRKRLPSNRDSITHRVQIYDDTGGATDVYITVGLYPMKRKRKPGEMFLKTGKVGSTMRGLLDILGIQTSLLLQYGVPLSVVCKKMKNVKFEPSGKTDNPQIPTCHSLADYIFTWLEMEFSG